MAYPLSASVAAGSAVFSPRYYVQRKGIGNEGRRKNETFSHKFSNSNARSMYVFLNFE